jgi:hypothetical protein
MAGSPGMAKAPSLPPNGSPAMRHNARTAHPSGMGTSCAAGDSLWGELRVPYGEGGC